MAIRLTESRLRGIIREEAQRLAERRPLREAYSYGKKLGMLRTAHAALVDVQEYEAREAGLATDPELDDVISALEGYMEAVEALAAEERRSSGAPVSYPTGPTLPRSMRH